MKLLLPVAFAATTSAVHGEALDLVCRGTAVHTEATESFGSVTTSDGHSASGDATT